MTKAQHAYGKSKQRVFNVKSKSKRPNASKVCLKFDEDARKEFLTGFRKRKNERRKKAQEEILQTLKDEKKRIKQQKKDEMMARVKTYKDVNDLDTIKAPESYDLASHTITVTDVSSMDFVGESGLMLGANMVREEVSEGENNDEKDDAENSDKESSLNKSKTTTTTDKKKKARRKKHINFSHKMDKHTLMKARRKTKKENAGGGRKPKTRR